MMKLKEILDSEYSQRDIRIYLYADKDLEVLAANKAVGMAVAHFVNARQSEMRSGGYYDMAMSNSVISKLSVFYMLDPEVVKAEAIKYGKYLANKTKVTINAGAMGLLGLAPYYTEEDVDFINENQRIYIPVFSSATAAIAKHTSGIMDSRNV